MSLGGNRRLRAKAWPDAFETRGRVRSVQGLERLFPLARVRVPAGGVGKLTSLVLIAQQFRRAAGKVDFGPADKTGRISRRTGGIYMFISR